MKSNASLLFVRAAAQAAEDKKGEDIIGLDVRNVSSVTESFLFVGATSYVHVRALEDAIRQRLKNDGVELKRTDGKRGHPWRVLDYGAFIVHIMEQEMREFYSLERLWNQAKKISLTPPKRKVSAKKKVKKK